MLHRAFRRLWPARWISMTCSFLLPIRCERNLYHTEGCANLRMNSSGQGSSLMVEISTLPNPRCRWNFSD